MRHSSMVSTICVVDVKYYIWNILRRWKIVKAKRILWMLYLRIFIYKIKRWMAKWCIQTVTIWENIYIEIISPYKKAWNKISYGPYTVSNAAFSLFFSLFCCIFNMILPVSSSVVVKMSRIQFYDWENCDELYQR